jgi:hypothetical protein
MHRWNSARPREQKARPRYHPHPDRAGVQISAPSLSTLQISRMSKSRSGSIDQAAARLAATNAAQKKYPASRYGTALPKKICPQGPDYGMPGTGNRPRPRVADMQLSGARRWKALPAREIRVPVSEPRKQPAAVQASHGATSKRRVSWSCRTDPCTGRRSRSLRASGRR